MVMSWDLIRPVIQSGLETDKVDLKETFLWTEKAERVEMVKDCAALANSLSEFEIGYVVIGIRQQNKRGHPSDLGPGWTSGDADKLNLTFGSTMDDYVDPPIKFHFHEDNDATNGLQLGLIEIPKSIDRPHVIAKTFGNPGEHIFIREGDVWVRRYTKNSLAFRVDIITMCKDQWLGEKHILESMIDDLQKDYDAVRRSWRELEDEYKVKESNIRKVMQEVVKLYLGLSTQERVETLRKLFDDHSLGDFLDNLLKGG